MDISAWELLLPEGILDYFDVDSVEITDESYTIRLLEKPLLPNEFSGEQLVSKGYVDEITLSDFPLRGKAVYLKVKRRRWMNITQGKIVSRDWDLVAKGTRMTREFAAFLKAIY